ncbi:type VI secretion protein, partial [Streptomyces sp. WAC 06725]
MLRRLLTAVRFWSSPRSPATDRPLYDFLRDPAGSWHVLLTHLGDTLTTWGPATAVGLITGALVLCLGRVWRQHYAHRRLARGAQIITVLPPPDASPDGASALWAHLAGLLLPARRHSLCPGPHLSWEYLLDRGTVRIRLWVPGTVPPHPVARAVEAAWPGARTHT